MLPKAALLLLLGAQDSSVQCSSGQVCLIHFVCCCSKALCKLQLLASKLSCSRGYCSSRLCHVLMFICSVCQQSPHIHSYYVCIAAANLSLIWQDGALGLSWLCLKELLGLKGLQSMRLWSRRGEGENHLETAKRKRGEKLGDS